MRESRCRAQPDQFDIKEDIGAMVDIEFLVQYLVLQHAANHPEITRWTDNVRLLQALAETGIVDGTTAYRLRQAYLIFRAVVTGSICRSDPLVDQGSSILAANT
jgi:glutamate-ammonia-ligase adenylyltransferase